MQPEIRIKRVYEPAAREDGLRVLVDRLWPRGITKAKAAVKEWHKDLAPSAELREWFGHDPERWSVFREKYKAELKEQAAVDEFIEQHEDQEVITLVYAAKDTTHTHAIVLQHFLEQAFKKSAKK